MNRTQAVERLMLGRMLEAEGSPSLSGQRLFIEVRPNIDDELATLLPSDSGVEAIVSRKSANACVIKQYRVHACLLNPGWEDYQDDWDHYLAEEKWLVCATLEELEAVLSTSFKLTLDAFQVPGNTASPL